MVKVETWEVEIQGREEGGGGRGEKGREEGEGGMGEDTCNNIFSHLLLYINVGGATPLSPFCGGGSSGLLPQPPRGREGMSIL